MMNVRAPSCSAFEYATDGEMHAPPQSWTGMNPGSPRLLVDALAFAAYKHRRQRRKDPEASPYINHPIALAHVLSSEAGISNAKVLAAAILHDTIEDTETTYEELRERFGKTIAGVVREVSDDKTLSKADRKRMQIEHAEHLSRRGRRGAARRHSSY